MGRVNGSRVVRVTGRPTGPPQNAAMPHPFDDATRLAPLAPHRFAGATHPAYANMVGPYGGVTAATLLAATLQHPERLGDPVALTVNFAAPLTEGGFEVDARPVRTNRSTQHWTMALSQGGETAATATAVFAARRDTWSETEAEFPRDMPPAGGLERLPLRGAPPWTLCYDMRFAQGEAPRLQGQPQPHSRSRLWVRDEPARPLDFASLAAICDCFFPRIYMRRGQPAPIGTVSLTCFFHADAAQLVAQGERHLLGSARALNFRNGYFDQSAEVWGDDGQLLASTHQMVYYRE